jgi:ABC-type antimicrobial peptide transport system permease subunit
MALGARERQVISQVLRDGMATALAGTAVGIVGAAAMARLLEGTIYGADATEPVTFAVVVVALLSAAFVACVIPARRAATVDPMIVLREG